jgi:hypothetical protein
VNVNYIYVKYRASGRFSLPTGHFVEKPCSTRTAEHRMLKVSKNTVLFGIYGYKLPNFSVKCKKVRFWTVMTWDGVTCNIMKCTVCKSKISVG